MIKNLIRAAGGILLMASAGQTVRAVDTIWCDDAIPAGAWTTASGGDSWSWINSNPPPSFGAVAHQSAIASGIHYHAFAQASATLAVNTGDTLYTYVYLDPANPPQEVMFEWFDGSSWAHAAYWGANQIPWGVNGTASQYPVGALPATGQWVRLEVPASAVSLEGKTVSGMQFILYNGRATFDDSGKGSQTQTTDTTPPAVAFASPANGATVSGSSVMVSANASDNVGVASVQFTLDGANLGSAFNAAPYSLTWNSTAVADGSHTLGAMAKDAAGNTAVTAITINVGNSSGGSSNITASALPGWVNPAALFNWKPMLGGVCWMDSRAVMKLAAPCLKQSSRPVLVDIKSDAVGFGYRFDQNSWASDSPIHTWFNWDGTDNGTPASPEDALQIFGATSNAQFIMNIPIPLNLTAQPSGNWGYDGYGYTWQTPAFYAAMVQYLTGAADAPSVWQNLPSTMDFNSTSAGFNWANLRARRGRVAPYPIAAFIIGEEPYNLEGTPTGSLYGPQAEKFRQAIRARGYTGQLGLHMHDMGIVDDPGGAWFYPMMSSLNAGDFSFVDLEHYYQFSTVTEDFKRAFPVSINPTGFQGWWLSKSTWKSDYTKFLWIVPDTRNAIRDDSAISGLGDPARWNLGFSEHGIQITSQFTYNDMFSAMQWANWLAECMRQNITWDSSWTLVAEGFSHAQLQVRNGCVTRTPMFFVYQMAQDFYGYDCLTNSYASPATGATVDNQNRAVQYPLTTVRTFRDPATGNIHLWVVNQSTNSTAAVSGFESWNVIGWKQLSAASYAANNPLGVASTEPIQPVAAALPAPGQLLVIPPISVNHIILSAAGGSTNVADTIPPTVSLTAPLNNAIIAGSSMLVSANASDNVGVASVQFKLDGVNLGSVFTAAPYGGTWDSTTVADGAHTLTAVATDTSGNQAAASVAITVSNVVSALSLPSVSIVASPATAVIGTTNYAIVTIARVGDSTQPLTVNYTLGGTAVKWDDYYHFGVGDMPASVTIPAGVILTNLVIVARGNETGANPETAVFTLATNAAYTIGSPGSATITIVSNTVVNLPTVTVAATAPNASRVGPTNGAFTLTRTGSTASSLTVNLSLGGTAANGVDYTALATALTIPAGSTTAAVMVAPLPSASYVGAETAVLNLSANSACTVGTTSNATITIAGNSVPCTIGSAPGHTVKVTWKSAVGKIYRVACKNHLSDTTWTNLSGLITATATTTSYTDTTASKSTTRYYLVYVIN